jgi:ribonuclease/clavin/mitogillin
VSGEAGLYERVLLAGGGESPAPKPPRPSAAIVLWRRTDPLCSRISTGNRGELEVYWIRRGRTLPFMAGWHAFPGGGLDKRDLETSIRGEPRHPSPERPTRPAPDWTGELEPDLAPGLAAAALRELEEEVGVRIDDADRLSFAGRWLTPPFGAVRFDNRFFLAEWRASDGEPEVIPGESESGEWIAPAAALAALDEGGAFAAPPIRHLLRVLAETGPERAAPRLLDTAEANLGPLRRIELRPHVLLFPMAAATLPPASHTNAFVVGSGDCVLIDPGSPFAEENERLLAALAAARDALGRRVVEIWLSHHHPDHVAGVETLRAALGVPVAAHAATAERLAPRGIRVDRELAGGERVELAGEPTVALRLHHTPGHARGHLAIEIERPDEQGSDLLGGDLVAGFGTIVIDPPEGNMDDYLDSLAAMRGRGFRTLFPAHGAPILEVDAKLEEYVAHRLAREGQVLSCWRSGAREPSAMIATVYRDVPAAVHPLAERQIVAHLERLRRRGAIEA